MKALIFILFASVIFAFCTSDTKSTPEEKYDSIASPQPKLTSVRDTTIEYSIEGISAEGTSAIAKYTGGKIAECTVSVYGETGQIRVYYTFKENRINVTEKQFSYNASIENVKTEKDMKVNKEFTYVLDLSGTVIGKVESDRADIFSEFKKVVPFEIK